MPEAPRSFHVLAIRDYPSPDPKRLREWDRIVQVELTDKTVLTVRLPREDYDEKALTAAVKAQIAEREPDGRREIPL